jgi:hypothetical protein
VTWHACSYLLCKPFLSGCRSLYDFCGLCCQVYHNLWTVSENGIFVALVQKDDGSTQFEYRGVENQTLIATVPLSGNLCNNDQPICYASDLMYLSE